MIRDRRVIEPPAYDHEGRPLFANPSPRPEREFFRDRDRMDRIGRTIELEQERDRWQWHEEGRWRWSHHRDDWGVDWVYIYSGPTYYRCRWEHGRIWWFEPAWGRWVYWCDGYWCWMNEYNVVYVYQNDAYYQYVDVPGGYSLAPAAPAADYRKEYYSADGSRLVVVSGDSRQADLYQRYTDDQGEVQSSFLATLGTGVTEVRFQKDAAGSVAHIVTLLSDGSFGLFDGNGSAVPSSVDSAPPPSPDYPELTNP
jgi:hypothetical protein